MQILRHNLFAKKKTIKAASKLTKDITLSNTFVFSVVINAILIEQQQKWILAIDQASLTIQPNEEAKITVIFQPLAIGKKTLQSMTTLHFIFELCLCPNTQVFNSYDWFWKDNSKSRCKACSRDLKHLHDSFLLKIY